MNIAFYLDEMNFRGVANSTYNYALNNENLLRNNSIIFYNKKNKANKKEVINKFKKKFKIYGISKFSEIDSYKEKLKIEYLYTQKSGNKDNWSSHKIKTIIHAVYPQKLNQLHGYKFAYISEWLSTCFSNKKIPFIPYIVETKKIQNNFKKEFKIKNTDTVFGCHGGESSFDMKFSQKAVLNVAKKRKNIYFLFLNINKFCNHPQIIFLKGTADEKRKKLFINTCDAMIYGRSLGESFGLACGEFILENKSVISYKYNRHRSHEHNINKRFFYEYGSYNDLCKLLLNFKKTKNRITIDSKYKNYKAATVMKIFNKVFLSNKAPNNISIIDHFLNLKNHLIMHYYYLRHKIYNHYFNFFESKFINLKD